ncbi:MAG TPA: glycosyltransferase family 1 protein [Pyrinomonadaceae bacterium]|nr:glycosyltransferase family 1 protein [Pyrinomonadaceae bacterium]
MSIALDGLPLTTPKTGVGHYTFELAMALAESDQAHEFELVYPSSYPKIELDGNAGSELPKNLKLERVLVGPLARHWWSNGLPRYVRRNRIELFHGTNYDVPLWRRCATVLTIHDLSLQLHPQTHQKRSVRRGSRRLPLMARVADAIIVPTKSVGAEVCERLKISRDKVFAVAEAARASFRPTAPAEAAAVRRRLGVRDNFLLAVGTLEPRKNLLLLISAFEALTQVPAGSDLQLVIAGGHGWLSGPLLKAVAESPVRSRILLTDYLHDDDLRGLYSSCRAFVYPSIYEGFGLPPLEAMACGAPVIASSIPALIETLGNAAQFFDPLSSEQLVEAITRVTTDDELRQHLVSAGLLQTEKFSWKRTAQATLAVYEVARKNFAGRR